MPKKPRKTKLAGPYIRAYKGPVYGGLGEDPQDPQDPPTKKARVRRESCALRPNATIQLCMRRQKPSVHPPVSDANSVCHIMRGLKDAAEENFYALHLDTRHNIIEIDHVSKGSVNGVEAHPREVFKSAILNNAAAIIIVHNHPSGDPTPSSMDLQLTKRIKEVGDLVGIQVLDHVIVGKTCKSIAEMGWMGADFAGYKKKIE